MDIVEKTKELKKYLNSLNNIEKETLLFLLKKDIYIKNIKEFLEDKEYDEKINLDEMSELVYEEFLELNGEKYLEINNAFEDSFNNVLENLY